MATRISYQFVTRYDETYRVDIDDSDFVGTTLDVDAATDGFTLSYSGATDSVNPGIIGSSCSMSILVTPGNTSDINTFATDLISSGESEFTVAIYKITAGPTVSLYWTGYILTDLSAFEDIGTSYFFTIKAVDGLARLKEVEYKDDSVSPVVPYGPLSLLTHVKNCLTEVGTQSYWGGSDVWLRTVVNWQDGNMPTATAAKDPLQFSRVTGYAFAKRIKSSDGEDWEYMKLYRVLEEICKCWGARLMLSNGAWRFEQMRERMEEQFYERRYSTAGTLLSSTSTATYDKGITQTSLSNRLHGGQFAYLPALSKVEVKYDHKTYKNQLENLSYKWYKGSGSNTPYAVTNLTFDADTYFRFRGSLFVDVSVTTYTKPWRYVFGLIIKTTPGDYRLDSETTAVVVGGVGVPTLNREPPNWQNAGVYYEVSTPWIFSTNYIGVIPNEFACFTPYLPASQTGFSVDLSTGLGGRDYAGNSVTATLNDWRFSNLELAIQGLDVASNYEAERLYQTDNVNTGNSDAIKIETLFGHAVKPWTVARLETTSDVTFVTWNATTATWERENENQSLEFGDLLSNQLQKLQAFPVQTYSGTLLSALVHVHSRIVFPDNSTWLINRGEWRARDNEWQVEMMTTGVADDADLDTTTPVPNPTDTEILVMSQYGFNTIPGSGTGTMTASGFHGQLALAYMTGNTVSTLISAGTITSIPVDEPIKANSLFDGDLIYVLDPQSGQTFSFVVDGNQSGGATSISVDSIAISNPIPIGAQVIPSPLNMYTTSGGAGTSTPSGTAEGQILVWDNVALQWVPLSGTVDGNVLTWDTANGWQEQALSAGTGDILDGGNTTGATVVIGTNDNNALNFETNNVVRVAISSGASTGGAVTITDVTANTSTVEDVLSLIANSTGTALAGLGPGIAFYAESSTTDSTLAGRIWAAWLTVTHATRKSKIGFHAIYNGTEVEVGSFDAINAGAGRLLIGASSPAVYASNGITIAATYTIGNSSSTLILGANSGMTVLGAGSGDVQIGTSSTGSSAILLQLTSNTATSTSSINIGGHTALTQTSGTRDYMKMTAGFAPTSGTAVHNSFVINGVFNQTGGASGITRGIYLNHTLTAVADMRLLEIAANGSNTKGIYQTGASVVNNFVGATSFGTTTAPDASAIVDIVSTAKGLGLPAMTTAQVNAISSPRDGLTVYDTDTDTIKLRANGAWASLGTGSGTVTGSGSAGQIAYWSGASAITGENQLYYDATNNRLGLNQASPAKTLSIVTAGSTDGIRMESDGTADQDVWGVEFVGVATGPYTQRGKVGLDVYSNSGASPDGHAIIFQLARDGGTTYTALSLYNNEAAFNNASGFSISNNAGRLRLQATSAGVYSTDTHWLLTTAGTTTNDTNSRLKIVSIGTTSSNYGLRIYNSTPTLIFSVRDDQHVGINVDPSDAILQVKGLGTTTGKSLLVEDSAGSDNFHVQDSGIVSGVAFQTVSAAPTASYGTGAGTGPATDLLAGGQNGFNFYFTTGTSPAASTTVVTINLPKSFANGCAASWVAANAATQAIIGNFWLSGTGNNSITIAYAGTLAASTAYALSITVIGY